MFQMDSDPIDYQIATPITTAPITTNGKDHEINKHKDNEGNNVDEISLLRQKLMETEDKLVKFKNFVVTLRNERNQLKEKTVEDASLIEKLKSHANKGQNSSQLFQNFQKLQNEYDKSQDEIDQYKKKCKNLENDLAKCVEDLSQLKVENTEQKEEIKALKTLGQQQDLLIETQNETIQDFESKIIILEEIITDERAKVQNYESNVDEMNALQKESINKTETIDDLQKQLADQSITIGDYESKLREHTNVVGQLEALQKQNIIVQNELDKSRDEADEYRAKIDKHQRREKELQTKLEVLEKKIEDLQLTSAERISALELEIYELKNKLQLSESDLRINNEKFEEYKAKVANVLKGNKINHCDYSRNMESLNLKLKSLQAESGSLKTENESLTTTVEQFRQIRTALEAQLASVKVQLKDYDVLKQSFELLTQENDKLTATVKQLQISFAKEKSQINDASKATMDDLRTMFETKIKDLEEELLRLRNEAEAAAAAAIVGSDDSNSVVNSNTSFEEINKEESSSTQSNLSNGFEKNFLEEILSNDNVSAGAINPKSSAKNGLTVENLTQLLAESENNISLLSEQNRVLKEEIRRLHRSIDRLDIANNLEYLKNVLIKFLKIPRQDEREQLIGVLNTILKLTPDEVEVFHTFVPEGRTSVGSTSTNSKWNIWQWS